MSRYTLCLGIALIAAAPLPRAEARRTNVVIIVGDDHQNDVYGAYGSKLAQTPNLDKLASEGVRFDRAYCNSPMCSSSRQSMLTGRYPHATGVTLLRHPLDESSYTLANRLREAGYRTGAFGKMHFNTNKLYGFEVHRTGHEFWKKHRKRGKRPLPEGVVKPPKFNVHDHARVWLNSAYQPQARFDDEMPDTWYAREAIAFMKEHREEPFFVEVGFHQPHCPYTFPVEYRNRYNPQDFVVPIIGPEDIPQIPKIFVDLTYGEKQGIIASYYTSTAYLDLNVGRVLKAIDELGLANDTMVVYLGDNGYHLGQHGRFEKHCCYERAVRVPLVMRLPGRIPAEKSTLALAEFVDVVPTVLDYLDIKTDANQPAPRDLQGKSLRPVIEGKAEQVRKVAFSEYQHTEIAMARTSTHKLIYRTSKAADDWMLYEPIIPPKGRGVFLYDLKSDPEELHNVADDPANAKIVSDLLDRLADWYRRTPPVGAPPPENLSREEFLDWAIAPRNPPS